MDLPAFIRDVGVEKCAKLFGAKPGAVKSWLYRERYPRQSMATRIVEKTGGKVTFAGIYGERAQ